MKHVVNVIRSDRNAVIHLGYARVDHMISCLTSLYKDNLFIGVLSGSHVQLDTIAYMYLINTLELTSRHTA
jgi:hypothetical protein